MKSYLRNYIINPHTTLSTLERLGYHADRGLGYVDYSKLITMYDDEDGKEYDGAEVYMCLDIDIERGMMRISALSISTTTRLIIRSTFLLMRLLHSSRRACS